VPDPTSGRFRDLTLDAFVARLSSAEPAPGGGSASAVAASLGASLVAMVAALSEGRPKYADHAVLHTVAGAAGRRLADRFLALADEDAAAYSAFAAALKLPRDTDAQRDLRSAALRSAARVAADVPLACVEACAELVAAAEALAGRSNANASSDLGVAALLGEAAARGAAANVLVNLPSIGDDALAAGMRDRVEGLVGRIAARAAATRAAVGSGSARPPLADADLALLAAPARD
jgi:glutamate formiminotransferase/formiminotetrahydrofolate cyclodeaminase